MKTWKFRLPIGDWSGDGHDICENFVIEATVPHFSVKEEYEAAVKASGVELHKYCADYEDNKIPAEIVEQMGFSAESFTALGDMDFDPVMDCYMILDPKSLARVWCAFVSRWTDSSFTLCEEFLPPRFTSYSFGYGLYFS